jgi:lipopolysaccharide/colanic/teichoic acid biosynthesis glycosyltransferase
VTTVTPSRQRRLRVKRILDVVIAIALLLFSLPALVAIAVVISATSAGGPIFTQIRVGKDGREFHILKFRSMTVDPDLDDMQAYSYDRTAARVTPVGRFLRRFSLDELPQLWNVIRGDMSLVGPRPDLRRHVLVYSPTQRRRLEMQPGITGWAQIHGRNSMSWEERIKLDIEYIDGWSLRFDARILVGTVSAVIHGSGTELSEEDF